MFENISDDEILQKILEAEDELRDSILEPKVRSIKVPVHVMEKLGRENFVAFGNQSDPLFDRISEIQRAIYRPIDFAVGGQHGGVFIFRGIVAKLMVPTMYGTVGINPFEMNDLTHMQREWMCSSETDKEKYIEAYGDVFDLAGANGASGSYPSPPEMSKNFITLSGFQLQAATASLISAYDVRGAVQSALIGAELAMKAALLACNYSEEKIIKYGHNLKKLSKSVGEEYSSFDELKIFDIVSALPQYVENRYSPQQPSRSEVGKIVMDAQHVAGEVARALTGFSFVENLSGID